MLSYQLFSKIVMRNILLVNSLKIMILFFNINSQSKLKIAAEIS